MKHLIYIILILSISNITINSLTENPDMSSGSKRIKKNMTIVKAVLHSPFKERHYIVYDSVGTNNKFYITHWLKTSFEEHYYPFFIEQIKQGDVIRIFNYFIKIQKWDRFSLWYAILDSTQITEITDFKEIQPQPLRAIQVDSSEVNKLFTFESKNYDSLKLKQEVKKLSEQSFVFQNLNELYEKSKKKIQLEQYKKCLDDVIDVISKKNIEFYGLSYFAGLCCFHLNDYEEAFKFFTVIDELIPNYPLGKYGIAVSLMKMTDYQKAFLITRQLVKQFPNFEPGFLIHAKIQQKLEINKKQIQSQFPKNNKYSETWETLEQLPFPIDIYHYSIKDLSNVF